MNRLELLSRLLSIHRYYGLLHDTDVPALVIARVYGVQYNNDHAKVLRLRASYDIVRDEGYYVPDPA